MGLLDWLGDAFGGSSGATQPMPPVQPMDNAPPAAQQPTPMMPPVQPMDMTTGPGTGGQPQPQPPQGAGPPAQPVPLPQPRPAAADAALPPNAAPTMGAGVPSPSATPAPAAAVPATASPPIAPDGAAWSPALTPIGRAFNLSPSEDSRVASSLAAGLKSVGDNWNKPGLAAFSGSAGSAMQGGQTRADIQQKQAIDLLNTAIKEKQAGNDAGYKRAMTQYYVAKALEAQKNAMADKDAAANKNDSDNQKYWAAQRDVAGDRRALNTQLENMRKEGSDPAEIARTKAAGEAAIQQRLQDHYAAAGIHPQTAAQIAKQPGNSQENPIDAGKAGITKDNIGKKLQPGQFFRNPSDGKVYQYKGPPKSEEKKGSGTPDKPTAPEPINPMKPEKSPLSAMAKADADDDED